MSTRPSVPASGWTSVDTNPTQAAQGRTFQRPLGVSELGFLWDGFFNGIADNIHHVELRLVEDAPDPSLFSTDNITRAWLSTKRRYPLAGATVQGADVALEDPLDPSGFTSQPRFVVRENDLAVLRPDELVFWRVTCAEDVQERAATILNGPRLLSAALLAQLHVFYVSNAGSRNVVHLLTLTAHCVTDWVGNKTFIRCLVDTLARGGQPRFEPPQMTLEDRLGMAIPLEDREPLHLRAMSPAKRGWRRAVGTVMFRLRMARRQGGHTLPSRLAGSTSYISARSRWVSTSLAEPETANIIANCRLHDLTFSNAYLALAQVAMTRVLYRRYLRGEISKEEWEYRERQPHITGGPLNLRPYQDKAWFERGGGGEFVLSIGYFHYELPCMTLGKTTEQYRHRRCDQEGVLLDGAPPFSELLSFDRFLHRAGLVKKQATTFFGHPLFHEIVRAASLSRTEFKRMAALQWMKPIAATDHDELQPRDAVVEVTHTPAVWAHGGSSVGNIDLVSPSEYPLPPTHPLSPCSPDLHPQKAGYVGPLSPPASEAATIRVENSQVHLHTRPGELYLGAESVRGRLHMHVFFDGNVFEDAVVQEWLGEVRGALLWYLGRMHPPPHGVQQRSSGADGNGRGQRLRAKF